MAIFDFSFHNPNPWIDDYLHGDHTHTDEDGEEVVSPGTPDRPVVIETEPEPDPDPDPNPGPFDDQVNQNIVDNSGGHLVGGDNDDSLGGAGGPDVIIGGAGNDLLSGGGSARPGGDGGVHYDLLIGGPGDDRFWMGGRDKFTVMIGGPGRDLFDLFGMLANPPGYDSANHARIMDFQDGADRIRLEADSGNPPAHGKQLTAFYNAVSEAGLTFDMRWLASEMGRDVVIELADDTITLVDTRLSELQLAVIDGDLFIV